MPSYKLFESRWALVFGLFIGFLMALDVVLIWTLITDYTIPSILEPYENKIEALMLMVLFITALIFTMAPVYLIKQIKKRGKLN